MRMLVKMSSFSVALLVMMLLNAQPNKGSSHSQCNSSMDECFNIMDVDIEVLLDTEISMRQLATTRKPFDIQKTGVATKPYCDRLPYVDCTTLPNAKARRSIYRPRNTNPHL